MVPEQKADMRSWQILEPNWMFSEQPSSSIGYKSS